MAAYIIKKAEANQTAKRKKRFTRHAQICFYMKANAISEPVYLALMLISEKCPRKWITRRKEKEGHTQLDNGGTFPCQYLTNISFTTE